MLWTKKPELISITNTPSLLLNNLGVHGNKMIFAHKNEVNIINNSVHPIETTNILSNEKTLILQIHWLPLKDKEWFVLTKTEGFEVWDATSKKLVHACTLSKELELEMNTEEISTSYCQGFALLDSLQEFAVGTSMGNILICEVHGKNEIRTKLNFSAHKYPITCLTASSEFLVSADNSGTIITWDQSKKFTLANRIYGKSYPVTSMGLHNNYIVASYSTGHIRFFHIHTGTISAEIAAHSRCINALKIEKNMVFSVGDDSFLQVWEVSSKGSLNIELSFSYNAKNSILTGVDLLENGSIVASSYDECFLHKWTAEI